MTQKANDRRIDYIEFGTRDLPRSRKFFEAVFGWEFKDWGPEYSSFKDGRLAGGVRPDRQPGTGSPLVVIYAADLTRTEAAVKEHGGTIVEPAFEFPGGRRFHFSEPGGNVLAVWSEK